MFFLGPKGGGWAEGMLSLQRQIWIARLREARGEETSPAADILPKRAEQSQC